MDLNTVIEADAAAAECHCGSAVCQCAGAGSNQTQNQAAASDSQFEKKEDMTDDAPISGGSLNLDVSAIDPNATIRIKITDTDIFVVNKKKIMEKSQLINNILTQNEEETEIELPFIHEHKWTAEMKNVIKFLDYTYSAPPKPIPERGEHFTKENMGSQENADFINTFHSNDNINEKGIPLELANTLELSDYLCISGLIEWCCAKIASILVKSGKIKII